MVRPLKAAMESSTKPDSFSVSVWMVTCTSSPSATPRQQSMAAGVRAPVLVQLQADGAGADLLEQALGPRGVALAGEAEVQREVVHRLAASAPGSTRPGVQVVALVPVAGPVPPPIHVVMPLASASSACCGQMKWMWVSMPPGGEDQALAGDDLGGDAHDHPRRHAGHHVRVAGLADAGDAPVLDADVRLVDAGVVDDERVGDDARRARRGPATPAFCPMPSRSTLPPPNLHSSP